MSKFILVAALGLLVPLTVILVEGEPVGTVQIELGKSKSKPKKKPPDEEAQLHKMIDKLAKPVTTERDKFLEDLIKFAGDQTLKRPDAGDAEFNAWFDRLSGGGQVWREKEITHKSMRGYFKLFASRLEITNGEIRRDEFLRYARQYLVPGTSPPRQKKPPRPPSDEAEKLFRKLDGDGDGFLSGDEIPASLRGEMKRWDSNRDGKIDVQEYVRCFETRLIHAAEERGVKLPAAPAIERKRESEPPSSPKVYRPGSMPAGLPVWFNELDRDGDGQVGLYEWKATTRPTDEFLRFDLNQDGFITAEEWLRFHRAASSRVGQENPTTTVNKGAGLTRQRLR